MKNSGDNLAIAAALGFLTGTALAALIFMFL
jgi:hypothetical protein